VDGLVWEFYDKKSPDVTTATRVIRKSEPYGIPPVVAGERLSRELKHGIQQVLFAMHRDARGKAILEQLMIDRFVEPKDEWYDSIRALKIGYEAPPGECHGPEAPPK
jgi:phosphonate transport system substrate-binding protein